MNKTIKNTTDCINLKQRDHMLSRSFNLCVCWQGSILKCLVVPSPLLMLVALLC